MKLKFNRRAFVKKAIYAVLSLEAVYVFTNLLGKKTKEAAVGIMFDAGNVDLFENNKVYPFGSAHFYLSRLEDGGLLAISIHCTHLGCAVQFNQNENRFLCPCHASAFDKHGEVLSPPATRALDILPIIIRDNKVLVDITKPIRRDKYDASQLTYV
nr:Rieske (2Fe-2S) protein [uncultured Carboxylicivirga sp.]